MKKATKEKCKYYDTKNNACALLASGLCKCLDNCWYIKIKLNTPQKLDLIQKINKKMKNL